MTMTTGTAPARNAPPEFDRRRANIVFVAIAAGMLMAAIDTTIVSTALPSIVGDLGGGGHMSWVVTAYLLAEAVGTILVGRLGDLLGRKPVFQVNGLVFVAGSVVAGLAQSMPVLIGARVVQGLSGGGLMVTAMALIADIIPLRERGRYQGAIGAVFGTATVGGPLLGGVLTDNLSWRWCFYVNVPMAVVMLAMTERWLPRIRTGRKPVIDYPGIALIAAGTAALILAASWGGTIHPWNSPVIIGLFAAAAVILAVFAAVELRAREPTLPMHLFANPVFAVCAVLSFVVGFAMLGALTYLPTFLQFVDGDTATMSGVRILPMEAGILATSFVSGVLVSRTGRYKVFPVLGTAVMAAGLFLMSTMDVGTTPLTEALYILVLGLGIGCAGQVLTITVQNTVPYHDLGVATSGVAFFRTLGNCFGAAVFGTLYASRLEPNLDDALARTPGVTAEQAQDPEALHTLPAAAARPVIEAYADTIASVFQWVTPVALLGLVVALMLKQVALRDPFQSAASDIGEGFSAPTTADSERQLEQAVAALLFRERRRAAPEVLAASGSALGLGEAWVIREVHWRSTVGGHASLRAVADHHDLPPDVLRPAFAAMEREGFLGLDGDRVTLTTRGRWEADRISAAWKDWLSRRLGRDYPQAEDRRVLDRALNSIATQLYDHEQGEPRRPAGVGRG
ncbi:MDR family MFS transporter [Streptomyces capparidis]